MTISGGKCLLFLKSPPVGLFWWGYLEYIKNYKSSRAFSIYTFATLWHHASKYEVGAKLDLRYYFGNFRNSSELPGSVSNAAPLGYYHINAKLTEKYCFGIKLLILAYRKEVPIVNCTFIKTAAILTHITFNFLH